jgi:hypothetical protein
MQAERVLAFVRQLLQKPEQPHGLLTVEQLSLRVVPLTRRNHLELERFRVFAGPQSDIAVPQAIDREVRGRSKEICAQEPGSARFAHLKQPDVGFLGNFLRFLFRAQPTRQVTHEYAIVLAE